MLQGGQRLDILLPARQLVLRIVLAAAAGACLRGSERKGGTCRGQLSGTRAARRCQGHRKQQGNGFLAQPMDGQLTALPWPAPAPAPRAAQRSDGVSMKRQAGETLAPPLPVAASTAAAVLYTSSASPPGARPAAAPATNTAFSWPRRRACGVVRRQRLRVCRQHRRQGTSRLQAQRWSMGAGVPTHARRAQRAAPLALTKSVTWSSSSTLAARGLAGAASSICPISAMKASSGSTWQPGRQHSKPVSHAQLEG